MYTVRIHYDGDTIHDPSKGLLLQNPKLIMEDNCAGSFEFNISPEHPYISRIARFTTEISVYRDGTEIWAGRVIEENTDFYGVKHVYCEGLLSALCDTIQPPKEYRGEAVDVTAFLSSMLNIHNSQIGTKTYRWRPVFYAGIVDFEDNVYRYTNYETTLECIRDKLISRLGGHVSLRRLGNVSFYIDYRNAYTKTAQQVIRFGQNLLDYSKNYDASEIATVLVPLGARLEGQNDIQALEKYVDVSSVNNGSIFVRNETLIRQYGVCVKVVRWDDVTVPANLLAKAEQYLQESQFDNMQLEIRAVDFNLVDANVPAIDLLDEILVVSDPHGLKRYFPVTKMEIPLDSPENMILTLGTAVKTSLTRQSNERSAQIKEFVDSYVPPSTVLENAKEQASTLIKSGALGGHVVVLPNELYITDNEDITVAKKVWRWNIQGLGYSSTGKDGTYGTAITMEGKINANYITVGTMKADRIKGGTLTLGGLNNSNGVFVLQNKKKETIITLNNTGIMVEKGGSITCRQDNGVDGIAIAEIKNGMSTYTMNSVQVGYIGSFMRKIQSPYNPSVYTYRQGLQMTILPDSEYLLWSTKLTEEEEEKYFWLTDTIMLYCQHMDDLPTWEQDKYNHNLFIERPLRVGQNLYVDNAHYVVEPRLLDTRLSGEVRVVTYERKSTGRGIYNYVADDEYETGKTTSITVNNKKYTFTKGILTKIENV